MPGHFVLASNLIPGIRQLVGRRLVGGFGALPAFRSRSLQLLCVHLGFGPGCIQVILGRILCLLSIGFRVLTEVVQLLLPIPHIARAFCV